MSYNISALSYRRNSIAFQTVTKRSKSIITIINGRNVMKDNTVFLCDRPTMCSKQWPSIKKSKCAWRWNYSRTLQQDLITLLMSLYQLYKECPGKNNQYWHPIVYFNTFTAIVDLSRFNNSCLKSPASTLVNLTFQSRVLHSFSLNQLRNLSL